MWSSPALLLSILVIALGVIGLCLVVFHRDGVRIESRLTSGASLSELGFRPGEGLRAHAVGELLFTDEIDIVGHEAGGEPSRVKTTLTTDDRLLVEVNGHATWFGSASRPKIRPVGRIMTKDTTTALDLLAGRSETAIYYIPDGYPTPAGVTPKTLESDAVGVEEVYVLELTASGRPPLRFEAVRSAAMALCHWSRASRARAQAGATLTRLAFEDTLRSRLSRAS
ncbi:MAG: hypothetical protein KF819_24750 [Labilithrix sp.]|nr:hypothetical protein [Labilithrix sp.]